MQTRPQRRNRNSIPAEVKTVQIPASYWGGDGKWLPTFAVIKFTQK